MNFDTLPIVPDNTGVGLTRRSFPTAYHLNRFRICVAPPGADLARYRSIAANLPADLPKYMNPHTATVETKPQKWKDSDTLCFRGVAQVRPFSVPIYNPLNRRWIYVDVPEKLRDWAIPDVHVDWVGVKRGTRTATGFTAQTLKRNFLDSTDVAIKLVLREVLAQLESRTWWDVPLAIAEATMEEILSAYVVWVNQHHFLAGRRSFRFLEGKELGYTDERWVFETAAMERFSLLPYVASEIVMGRAEDVVRPVWVEMVQQVCVVNGLRVIPDTGGRAGWSMAGPVSYLQQRFLDYPKMLGSAEGSVLDQKHLGIHPS